MKNKISEKSTFFFHSLLYVSFEWKPGWRFTFRLSKDAVSASWHRFGRAGKRKIDKKMYLIDNFFVGKSISNHRKVASLYNEASGEGIQK